MIDPQYYSVLAEAIEWQWPARTQSIRFSNPPVITWHDGLPGQTDDEINAACAGFVATGRVQQIRQRAVNLMAEVQTQNVMVLRALMLALLDELNLHAAKTNAILTAIDSGGSLAQVKSNIAAIADYPIRTAAQIRTTINNKLTTGVADS